MACACFQRPDQTGRHPSFSMGFPVQLRDFVEVLIDRASSGLGGKSVGSEAAMSAWRCLGLGLKEGGDKPVLGASGALLGMIDEWREGHLFESGRRLVGHGDQGVVEGAGLSDSTPAGAEWATARVTMAFENFDNLKD